MATKSKTLRSAEHIAETEAPGSGGLSEGRRVNLRLPETAFVEASAAAKSRGWTFTQFLLFALGLGVRVTEEVAAGGQILFKSPTGEVREVLIPRW